MPTVRGPRSACRTGQQDADPGPARRRTASRSRGCLEAVAEVHCFCTNSKISMQKASHARDCRPRSGRTPAARRLVSVLAMTATSAGPRFSVGPLRCRLPLLRASTVHPQRTRPPRRIGVDLHGYKRRPRRPARNAAPAPASPRCWQADFNASSPAQAVCSRPLMMIAVACVFDLELHADFSGLSRRARRLRR